jgi:uncharacterized protein YjbI with pentapeptide repeats
VRDGRDFTGEDLAEAQLFDLDLTGKRFAHANLHGADLTGADLSRADFTGADLSGAYLNGVQADDTLIVDCSLRDGYLYAANLTGAVWRDVDLTGTVWDQNTQWPKTFTPPRPSQRPS